MYSPFKTIASLSKLILTIGTFCVLIFINTLTVEAQSKNYTKEQLVYVEVFVRNAYNTEYGSQLLRVRVFVSAYMEDNKWGKEELRKSILTRLDNVQKLLTKDNLSNNHSGTPGFLKNARQILMGKNASELGDLQDPLFCRGSKDECKKTSLDEISKIRDLLKE